MFKKCLLIQTPPWRQFLICLCGASAETWRVCVCYADCRGIKIKTIDREGKSLWCVSTSTTCLFTSHQVPEDPLRCRWLTESAFTFHIHMHVCNIAKTSTDFSDPWPFWISGGVNVLAWCELATSGCTREGQEIKFNSMLAGCSTWKSSENEAGSGKHSWGDWDKYWIKSRVLSIIISIN